MTNQPAEAKCPKCHGKGTEPNYGLCSLPCSACDGSGTEPFVRIAQLEQENAKLREKVARLACDVIALQSTVGCTEGHARQWEESHAAECAAHAVTRAERDALKAQVRKMASRSERPHILSEDL